jgi:FixJ family two-component response regulator
MSDLASSARGDDIAHVVYVLDDDAHVRASIALLLKGDGCEPHAFSEPTTMLDRVTQTVPDVVVLDLALGKTDAIV